MEKGYLQTKLEQLEDRTPIPTQSGNAGKFLTTDGSTVAWETVASGSGLTQAQVLTRLTFRI